MKYNHDDVHGYNINEFKFSPVGLAPYTRFDSFELPPMDIYSSPKIQKRTIEQVEASDVLKLISKKVIEGIENRRIIVGYTNPSKFKFLYTKIKQMFGLKKEWALGFFDTNDHAVYIVLDDNINLLGDSKYNITNVICHELCHMAANQYKKTKFIPVAMDLYYFPFYANFLTYVLSEKGMNVISEDDIKKRIKDNRIIFLDFFKQMTEIFDRNRYREPVINIKKARYIWFTLISNLLEKDHQETLDIVNAILDLFFKNYIGRPTATKTEIISQGILNAYEKIGFKNLKTLPGQEIIFLSEVVAITNQNGISPKIVKCINKINMGN